MKIILLADPAMKGRSVKESLDILDYDSFEQWKDTAYDTGVNPEIMFIGSRLIHTAAEPVSAYDALIQMFDIGIYPHMVILTSQNPLEQLRQSKLLKLMGYVTPSPCTWVLEDHGD